MGIRNIIFSEGEFYHIYNRGTDKRIIFDEKRDYLRFITLLYLCNNTEKIHINEYAKKGFNLLSLLKVQKENTLVEIGAYCLMPNHFHFLLRERKDGNISIFMHRVLVSYAKYFNLKYERRGHVFESKFNAKHIVDDNYLLRVSSYIHLNPKDLRAYKRKEQDYPWSTFQDYVKENRWGKLLCTNPIKDNFSNPREHYNFVSGARSDIIDSEFDFNSA